MTDPNTRENHTVTDPATPLSDVYAAATAATENIGKPGAGTRFFALQDALAQLTATDPTMAFIVAAARWTDRYGSAGAPARLADLADTIEHLRDAGAPSESRAATVEHHGYRPL